MALTEILAAERVAVVPGQGTNKLALLEAAASLLATGQDAVDSAHILEILHAREQLQSTGVGGGVAVPHATDASIDRPVAALLICSHPVAFDSIDGEPVSIVFALIGPKGHSAQHLKTLAQVSRLLRPETFRQKLALATSSSEAFALIAGGGSG